MHSTGTTQQDVMSHDGLSSSGVPATTTTATSSLHGEGRESSPLAVQYDATYTFFASAVVGVLSGFAVAMFKLCIESLREVMYGTSLGEHFPVALIPALGGVGVSLLAMFGDFSPGLRDTCQRNRRDIPEYGQR